MKVLNFPLTKISICFVFGVLISYYQKPSILVAISALIIALIIFAFLYFSIRRSKRVNIYFGIITYFTSFFIGVTTLLFHTDSLQKSNYSHCQKAFEKSHFITLTLREKLKDNDFNDRYIALINTIDNKPFSGKVLLNIRKDSAGNPFIIGNIFRLKVILQKHSSPKNPNQFNYGKHLTDKQIYAQIYAEKSEIETSKTVKKDIWYYTAKLHSRIIRNLKKQHFNSTEMNVALALILGQRQEINPNIIQDYQLSGATHILSVSGLHVGFIMFFITFILKPIPNNKKGSFIKLTVILSSLMVFAVISGLSPSVLRSVVMFSFIAIGSHLRRGKNIYHTLLISMFLILLFEPYFLFDVGFQLSYLALFFIIWLQPLLKQIWKPKNKILLYIWNVLTVSFAAQIGTLPLCLYYFHQFPGLFFVTNIVVLPVLSIIMALGIIVVTLAIFDANPDFLIIIFERSIYILNQIIHFVASFESFVIRNISFHFYHLIVFYLLIFTTIIYLKKPSYSKLISVLSTIILVQIVFLFTKEKTEQQHELIVFNLKKKSFISIRNGSKTTLFANDTLKLGSTKNKQVLDSYLVKNFTNITSTNSLKNVLFFNGKKIFIIDSLGIYTKQIQPNILILTQSPKINLDRLLHDLHPEIIIADASNFYSIQKYWIKTCSQKKIPFHSTNEKGFYKLHY